MDMGIIMANRISKRIRKKLDESGEQDTDMLLAIAIKELSNVIETLYAKVNNLEKQIKNRSNTSC